MFIYQFLSAASRRARAASTAALIAAALTSLLCGGAQAQIGAIESDPSQGIGNRATARNTVLGQVSLPNGMRLEKRAKVRITGATGGSLFTYTDENGVFAFRRLAAGTYFLTVEAGPEFQTASETVDIFGSTVGGGTTQTVYVQLRYKGAVGAKPGTVSAGLAEVPKPALKLYEKALKAAQAGEHKKAIEALKGAVELHPTFAPAYNELGVLYLRLNQLDEAAEALRAALKLEPENFTPRLNYGMVLFYQGRLREAEENLRAALVKREASAAAHFFLGRVLVKERDYREAERELRRAAELGGDEFKETYRYLGGVYRELGDGTRAVEALEKYLALEPKAKDADAIRQIIAELRARPRPVP